MTKKQIVAQEYKNLLETIYKEMHGSKDVVDLFYHAETAVKDFEELLYDICRTKRCARFMNEKQHLEEHHTLGTEEAFELTAYQKLIFNKFTDDYYEDTKKRGSTELYGLVGEYAWKMYNANPANKYVQIIAHNFGYKHEYGYTIEELMVGEDYKAIHSKFEVVENISEFEKKYEALDTLYEAKIDYEKLSKEQLHSLCVIIREKAKEQQFIIENNTPKPEFSRERWDGESYWEDNSIQQSDDQWESCKKAKENIEKYKQMYEKIKNMLKQSEKDKAQAD